MLKLTRRTALAGAAATFAGTVLRRGAAAQAAPKVVVIGGGFGGASIARELRRVDPRIQVVLVTRDSQFVTCPFSNAVIGGMRDMNSITFSYDGIRRAGIEVVQGEAVSIDPATRRVTLADGAVLQYDRLALSPGIDLNWNGIAGYTEAAAEVMPHAWIAGRQTELLKRQLEAMPDGGLVVMAVPDNPYRCPPGPYERASMIAHYLKQAKPRSKVMILDAKDSFSKQPLFQESWAQLYPGMVEWVSGSNSGKVVAVDVASKTVKTDFEELKPAVANIIPPQRAGRIAISLGLDQGKGFCEVDAHTFESKVVPGIHLVGDAIIAGGMPKSAFSANSQAKVCARAMAAMLSGQPVLDLVLLNTCYSVVGPDYGFSIAGAYRQTPGGLIQIEGSGGTSPLKASADVHRAEAQYAESWYENMTTEIFGVEPPSR